MSERARAVPELIVWPARAGEFVAGNVAARSWAVVDGSMLELLAELAGEGTRAELETTMAQRRFRAVDATRPVPADGLLGDPTGLDRDVTLADAEALELDAALALAERLMLVTADERAYADYFDRRRNVLDRGRRGDLHQVVGEHVLLGLRRPSVDEWWVDQKFTDDRREPRAGLYRDVQWQFARRYYTPERLAGRRVLDFGCGPGLFARHFAASGASVVALDTNEEHLSTAARLAADDGVAEAIELRRIEFPLERTLEPLAGEPFDLIFLSDVMMFYFHPYDLELELDPVELLRGLASLLADGGRLTILEPNGSFWHQPWLGSPERPFTALTEYRDRRFGVTPTLERLSRAAEAAGLAISSVRELVPPDDAVEGRDTHFAAEFPLWWQLELVALAGER